MRFWDVSCSDARADFAPILTARNVPKTSKIALTSDRPTTTEIALHLQRRFSQVSVLTQDSTIVHVRAKISSLLALRRRVVGLLSTTKYTSDTERRRPRALVSLGETGCQPYSSVQGMFSFAVGRTSPKVHTGRQTEFIVVMSQL